ncbi:MAG: NAD(P)-binding domain-containing protein, partial [Dehalococcoidales bacterium]
MAKVGFIGAGPVGTAFGVQLSQLGYEVIAVYDVSLTAAQRFAKAVPSCQIYQTAQ